jgi:hypothetical protein
MACYNYADGKNPPLLHRKEAFLRADDPRHEKFAHLTQQEEEKGLLAETASISTRDKLGCGMSGFGCAGIG